MSNGGAGISDSGTATTGPMAVIELLVDGLRLKKLYKEYEEKTTAHNELLAKIGPMQSIIQLRKDLEQQLADVPGIKVKAQDEASAIVMQARKDADEIKAKAQTASSNAKAAAAKLTVAANERMAEASSRLDAVRNKELDQTKKEQELAAREGEVATSLARLEQERVQVDADRAKLAEALAQAQAILK